MLLVEDDPDLGLLIERWLSLAETPWALSLVTDGRALMSEVSEEARAPDVICLDLGLPDIDGLEALRHIKRVWPSLPVVILTADSSVETVVLAMQEGAYDYLPKPLERTKLLTTLRNAVERSRMASRLEALERISEGQGWQGILGVSSVMRQLFDRIQRVAHSDVTVLLRGESGSGKELVARALHRSSRRREGPFVAVNCAAFPPTLIEAELFGHERGAFTGATHRRAGCFERADGGTIFLDEIGELDLSVQAKLLRVLQERAFSRLGGTQEIQSDFRLLTATHKDVGQLVEVGHFREDLFYRVAVLELSIPPLRDRLEDIPMLSRHFLRVFQGQESKSLTLSREALQMLVGYSWPGNVRELQNALQHATVIAEGELITVDDLPKRIRASLGGQEAQPSPATHGGTSTQGEGRRGRLPAVSLEELERMAIMQALDRHNGNLSAVMRQLGLGRTTLYRRLKKYGLR